MLREFVERNAQAWDNVLVGGPKEIAMSKRTKQDRYYKKIEEDTLRVLGEASTGFSACNVEVCEAILNHIRECFCIFSEETIEDTHPKIIPPSKDKAGSADD